MKKNIAIVLALVAFALISCEKSTPWEPGAPASTKQFLFFPVAAELQQELDPEANITSHKVVIERKDAKAALTAKIIVRENTDNVFEIPATATFEAGKDTTSILVKFKKMEVGSTYKFAIQLDINELNPYALDVNAAGNPNVPFYEYEATLIKYENGEGVIVDDAIIASTFGVAPSVAWTAKFQIAQLPSGNYKIRVLSPYCTVATAMDDNGIYDGYPYNAPEDFDASQPYNLSMVIDPVAQEVTMDDYIMGVDWGYGMMGVYNYGGEAVGEFDAEAERIEFSAADKALVFAMGSDLYNYAGFRFYLSKEAYVADVVLPAAKPVIDKAHRVLK